MEFGYINFLYYHQSMDEKYIKLERLLEDVLGEAKSLEGHNRRYHCPFCHHPKPKLVVNLHTQNWRCWVCPKKGTKIKSLFINLGVYLELKSRLKEIGLDNNVNNINQYDPELIINKLNGSKFKIKERKKGLPKGFKPLWIEETNNPYYNNAISYLNNRGINYYDILKYSIGYSDYGKYDGMIVIPSYNIHGELNYFVARSMYDDLIQQKHIQAPYDGKLIIGFENLINFKEELTLVEGGFDAMTVKRNCIPLFGQFINQTLLLKLMQYRPPIVNICLDADALMMALSMVIKLLALGIKVRLVEIPQQNGQKIDANNIGFVKMWELINSTPLINTNTALKKFIKIKLSS